MLRITKYVYSDAVEQYFSGDGLVHGKAAERLGIDGYAAGQVFNDLANNRVPGTQEKLTQRNVANRRAGWDMLLDARKSVSIHVGRTGDKEMLRMFCEATQETMQAIECNVETRVRGKGRNENRSTGNGVWATFIHEQARPASGSCDPHLHCHSFLFNGTFDETEARWKAVETGAIYAEAKRFRKMHDDLLARKLTRAGYKLRQTLSGWELAYVPDRDIKTFSKRTTLINREAQIQLEKLAGSARFLAKKNGISFEDAFAVKLGELGARTRERKTASTLSKEEQREDWRNQMGAQRWDAMSIDAAKAYVPSLIGKQLAAGRVHDYAKTAVLHQQQDRQRERGAPGMER